MFVTSQQVPIPNTNIFKTYFLNTTYILIFVVNLQLHYIVLYVGKQLTTLWWVTYHGVLENLLQKYYYASNIEETFLEEMFTYLLIVVSVS